MPKKQKKNRRGAITKNPPIYSEETIKRVGLVSIGRQEALIRLIDTAIWLWFQDEEPFTIHLIAQSAHNVLYELGFPPLPPEEIDFAKSNTVYDFLRHSATKTFNEGVDFVPDENGDLLYAVVRAFGIACGGLTTRMRVIDAYGPVIVLSYPEFRDIPEARDFLAKCLPKDLGLDEAISLGRIPFFKRYYPVFESDGLSLPSPCRFGFHLP